MSVAHEDCKVVLDTVDQGYLRLSPEFRCTFVNRCAQELLGTTGSEVLGKRLQELGHVASSLQELCSRAMAERQSLTLEHYFEPLQRWFAINAMPDAEGGLVLQFCDVTDSRRVEDALRTSEEKFSKAFRCSPTPMCI